MLELSRRNFIKTAAILGVVPLGAKIEFIERLGSTTKDPASWFMVDGVKVESLGIMEHFHPTEWDEGGGCSAGTAYRADVYLLTKEVDGKTLESYSLIDKALIDACPLQFKARFIKGEIMPSITAINQRINPPGG